jgi:predicted ATPase
LLREIANLGKTAAPLAPSVPAPPIVAPNWVIAGARTQPAVLAFEDLHWTDPTTPDLLRDIAERGVLAPLFVLITTRPEFRPPWGMRSHHAMIALAPLDRQQVGHMVGELGARHALPRSWLTA